MMESKYVIIFGGTRGIGKATAIALSQSGYHLVLTYVSNQKEAKETLNQLQLLGAKVVIQQCDVSQQKDVHTIFDEITRTSNPIHAVINAAGIATMKPLIDFTAEEFNRIFTTNVTGTFNILQSAFDHVASGGRIITFSSNVVTTTPVTYGPYAASKSAVETLTKTLAKELRGKNVSINCISPGPTATELFLKGKSETAVDAFANMSPLERLGQPEDIANVVRFLISDDAAWINGQVIRVNGGFI